MKINAKIFTVSLVTMCFLFISTVASGWSIFGRGDKEVKKDQPRVIQKEKAAPTIELRPQTPQLTFMQRSMKNKLDALQIPGIGRAKAGGYPSALSDPALRSTIRETMLDAYYGIRAINLLVGYDAFMTFTASQLANRSSQVRRIFNDLAEEPPEERTGHVHIENLIGRFADSMGQLAAISEINAITSCGEMSLTDCYAKWRDTFTNLRSALSNMTRDVDRGYYFDTDTQEEFCIKEWMCDYEAEVVGEIGTRITQITFWAEYWRDATDKMNRMADVLKEQAVYLGAPPPEI